MEVALHVPLCRGLHFLRSKGARATLKRARLRPQEAKAHAPHMPSASDSNLLLLPARLPVLLFQITTFEPISINVPLKVGMCGPILKCLEQTAWRALMLNCLVGWHLRPIKPLLGSVLLIAKPLQPLKKCAALCSISGKSFAHSASTKLMKNLDVPWDAAQVKQRLQLPTLREHFKLAPQFWLLS